MEERFKQSWSKVKDFFGKMSKKTKRLLFIVLGTLLIALVVFIVLAMNRPYTTLFTGLTDSDMSSILSYLEDAGVRNYRVENNDTILVPSSQEPALKAQLLMAGYPSSDFGYAMYLGNISQLSTDRDRNQLSLYDLQDRLGAVIRRFDGVKEAWVDIALGSDNSFVLNRNAVEEASAAVLVEMEQGRLLSDATASAIRKLVSNSVTGLNIDYVSLTDTAGNSYDGVDDINAIDSARLKLALEQRVNNQTRNEILQVLDSQFGPNNVRVAVNSSVDVSRIYVDKVDYEQDEDAVIAPDGSRGIIGSRVYSVSISRDDDLRVGGAVGTETNADLSTYVEQGYEPDGQERDLRSEGEDNYLVDTTHTQSESAGGTVTDLMVSVSINAVPGTVDTDALINLVGRAARIDQEVQYEKIAVMVSQWYEEPVTPDLINDTFTWVLYAAIAGAILFLLILLLIILLIRRSRRKKRLAEEAEAAAALAAMQSAAGEGAPEVVSDIMDIHTERSMELRKDVRRFAENNPEIAALMVKNWLKEDDNNG